AGPAPPNVSEPVHLIRAMATARPSLGVELDQFHSPPPLLLSAPLLPPRTSAPQVCLQLLGRHCRGADLADDDAGGVVGENRRGLQAGAGAERAGGGGRDRGGGRGE